MSKHFWTGFRAAISTDFLKFRAVLFITVIALIIGLNFGPLHDWYQARLTPANCSWSNRLPEQGNNPSAVFFVGSFGVDDPSIAYLVRIGDVKKLANPTPWLRENKGYVFVQNRLIARKPGVLQLFIDDGRMDPLRIEVPIERAKQYFDPQHVYFDRPHRVENFWDKTLGAAELLKSTGPRSIVIQDFKGASNGTLADQ